MARSLAIIKYNSHYRFKVEIDLNSLNSRLEEERMILEKQNKTYQILKILEDYTKSQLNVIEKAIKKANKNNELINLEELTFQI